MKTTMSLIAVIITILEFNKLIHGYAHQEVEIMKEEKCLTYLLSFQGLGFQETDGDEHAPPEGQRRM